MKILYSFFFLFVVYTSVAQVPTWQWAKGGGGNSDDESQCVASDPLGNIYVVGSFISSSITFGSFTLVNPNPGMQDIFIVKYNSSGTVQWVRGAVAGSNEVANGVSADAQGNIYVVGYFTGSQIQFGGDTLTNSFGSPADMFVVKYDGGGNVVWAMKANGGVNGVELAKCVSIDEMANIYVSGTYENGFISFGTVSLGNSGLIDVFTAKYDSAGTIIWARQIGGTGVEGINNTSANASGELAVVGFYESATLTIGSTVLTNSGIQSAMVAFYDSSGTALWAKNVAGPSDDATGVATEANGNVIVAGNFENDSITFDAITLNHEGAGDIFLAKYNSSGTVQWAKQAGDANIEAATSVTIDTSGENIFLTGYYTGFTRFDTLVLINLFPPFTETFVTKYDSSGNPQWAINPMGPEDEVPSFITVGMDGSVYITGVFTGDSASFDSTVLMNAQPFSGTPDVFVAKLSDITTSVLDNISNHIFQLYPNPAHNTFTISFNEQLKMQNAELKIFDVTSRLVHEQTLNTKYQILNTHFTPGIYLVKVTVGEKVFTEKLVVE
jgi:hypothetical protein